MQDLKVQIANQEDADMGVDLLGLNDPADGGAGGLPAAPGAFGPGCNYSGGGADLELYYTFCSGGPACAFGDNGGTASGLACLGGAKTSRTTSGHGGGRQ